MDQKFKIIYEKAIEEISAIESQSLDGINESKIKAEINSLIEALCNDEKIILNVRAKDFMTLLLYAELTGLGPLSLYLNDNDVGDVLINGYQNVFIEKNGKLEKIESYFLSNAHVLRILRKSLAYTGRVIDESNPIVDARLNGGIRLNAIISPISISGISVSIRKQSLGKLSFEKYISMGTCSEEMADILKYLVHKRANIIISGGTGSGKTTLLRLLASSINSQERIVTIEDAAELALENENLVSLETRVLTTGTAMAVTAQDLVVSALRMRPERIIVGECRSGETFQMLQAMNTGHDGSMSSLHANSVREAVIRIESMVLMSGIKIPIPVIKQMIAGAVDIIIQISKNKDGRRIITNIAQIVGIDNDRIVMHDVSEFKNGTFICRGLMNTGRFL